MSRRNRIQSSFTLWIWAVWKRWWFSLTWEWKRATVQVPTGLHSQTVMTGWSNYWAVDTPAWRGFISSRKGDSQITVYPHPAPSSGLIPQMQSHTQTPWHCWHSRACTHPHVFISSAARGHIQYPCLYSTCERLCRRTPWPSPSFPSNTPSQGIKAKNVSVTQVCEREAEKPRESEKQITPRLVFNSHPPLWIIIPP